jgi:hypothetical protein
MRSFPLFNISDGDLVVSVTRALGLNIYANCHSYHTVDRDLIQRLFPTRKVNRGVNMSPAVLRHLDTVRGVVVPTRRVLSMLNDEIEILLRRPDDCIRSKRVSEIDDP